MGGRLTQQEVLNRFAKVWGERYKYDKFVYVNRRTKCCISCPKHGDFWIYPLSHAKGHGCPKCGNESQAKKMSRPHYDFEEFVVRANSVHDNKYKYEKPKEYTGTRQSVTIHCSECGKTFEQSVVSHLSGRGCPNCKNIATSNRSKGKPLKKLRKKVCGIGIYDYEGVALKEKSYFVWREMIMRCYDKRTQEKHPSYKGCQVCQEWLSYSSYKEWYDTHYIKGCDVDKDLLSYQNERLEYSPQSCVFLPPEINSKLVRKVAVGGTPCGVLKNDFGYTARCGNVYLGSFQISESATEAYIQEKRKQILELATKWKGIIEDKAYDALLNLDIVKFFMNTNNE